MLEPTDENLVELCHIVEDTLPALRFFPQGSGGIAVARAIGNLVTSLDEARQLCQQIVEEYDDWPGPATLREHYLRLRRPAEPPRLERPQITCEACRDLGYRRAIGGRFERCSCANGDGLPDSLLELLNRPPRLTTVLEGPRRRGAACSPVSLREEMEVLREAAEQYQARHAPSESA